jgi:hypothetical protein
MATAFRAEGDNQAIARSQSRGLVGRKPTSKAWAYGQYRGRGTTAKAGRSGVSCAGAWRQQMLGR